MGPDVGALLRALPDPDPDGAPRIWARYRASRRPARAWWVVPVVAASAAAALIAVRSPEREQHLALSSGRTPFGDTVTLQVAGRGSVHGTRRDVRVDWDSGRVEVEVMPETGTRVAVVTEEAVVRVVGTVFSVDRGALGVTVTVARGKVDVACADGWRGGIGPGDPAHTCLPVRPGGLLGRADALRGVGALPAEVLDAVDRGLAVAEPGSAIEGELVARRIELGAADGAVEPVLADADRYLAVPDRPRATEIRRTAARLALRSGCARALPYLAALESAGTAEDRVVLASCLAPTDPDRALALVRGALDRPMDPAWAAWARSFTQGGR